MHVPVGVSRHCPALLSPGFHSIPVSQGCVLTVNGLQGQELARKDSPGSALGMPVWAASPAGHRALGCPVETHLWDGMQGRREWDGTRRFSRHLGGGMCRCGEHPREGTRDCRGASVGWDLGLHKASIGWDAEMQGASFSRRGPLRGRGLCGARCVTGRGFGAGSLPAPAHHPTGCHSNGAGPTGRGDPFPAGCRRGTCRGCGSGCSAPTLRDPPHCAGPCQAVPGRPAWAGCTTL